jgi:arylsulfatase A-like enzyme
MPTRPCFILFMTDQHRADHLGCYGNATVRTPHIDWIAARGSRFDRFYVASPICMPNRATLMTGRMPSATGVRSNGIPLSVEDVTFVDLLRAAGYRTGLVGKSHLQNFTGAPPHQKIEFPPGRVPPPEPLTQANRHHRTGAAYENELDPLWESPAHSVRTPFYGFDEVALCTGHGDMVGGDYARWLAARHDAPETLRGPANALPDNLEAAPQAWRTRVPEELYPTTFVAEKAVSFLERHANSPTDDPFFLQVSFPDPHHPFTPPGAYWNMYDSDGIALPESFERGSTPLIEQIRAEAASGQRSGTMPFVASESEAKRIIALTYGMITMVDDAIGRILSKVEELGLSDRCVLAFTSDHGDAMGDHGLMLKHLIHFHGLLRVPFIWADPEAKMRGDVIEELAGTIDIASTVLARAGLAPYHGIQGRDLFDPDGEPPPGMIVEEDFQTGVLGFEKPPRVRTLVTDDWRFTIREGVDWGEMYDLGNDPGEVENLYDRAAAAAARSRLFETMLRCMLAQQDPSPAATGRA